MNTDRFKFRVWDKNEQSFIRLADESFIDDDGLLRIGWKQPLIVNQKDYIIQQCTGLKDKNGNLIYEGDILELKDSIVDKYEVVEYPFNLTRWLINKRDENAFIVGNILENPDLLEQK